jgi:hypothetical protein
MAQDQQLIDIAAGTGWTQLTNADATTVTFQVREGEVEIHATIDGTEPSATEYGVIYRTLQGERNVAITDIVGLADVDRLWARALGKDGAKVYMDHV